MLIIGLTGSIGMGKSKAAAHFRALGIGVFDADAAVHELYQGAAAPLIEAAFPGTADAGGVDRTKLAARLGTSAQAFGRLEAIVHPLVRAAEREFLVKHAEQGASYAVLEIPLLFETGADAMTDAVIVVSTGAETQRARVLSRPGMTDVRFNAILARQMPDAEKRERADFVVDTSGAVEDTHRQINQILFQLEGHAAAAFSRFWEII